MWVVQGLFLEPSEPSRGSGDQRRSLGSGWARRGGRLCPLGRASALFAQQRLPGLGRRWGGRGPRRNPAQYRTERVSEGARPAGVAGLGKAQGSTHLGGQVCTERPPPPQPVSCPGLWRLRPSLSERKPRNPSRALQECLWAPSASQLGCKLHDSSTRLPGQAAGASLVSWGSHPTEPLPELAEDAPAAPAASSETQSAGPGGVPKQWVRRCCLQAG